MRGNTMEISKNVNCNSELRFLFLRYRKCLLAFICVIFIVCLLIFNSVDSESKVNASTYNEKYYKCITIDDNETLWDIAEEYISEEYDDVNSYIDEVKFINNLKDDKIYSGATLVIPYYASPM